MGHLDRRNEVQALLDQGVALRIGSGSAAAWGKLSNFEAGKFGTPVFSGKTSHFTQTELVNAETVFDLASLTKILATTSLYMMLDERGIIRSEALISDYFPKEAKENPQLMGVTFRHLLSHTSGLPAWKPFYETLIQKYGNALSAAPISIRKNEFYSLVLQVPREAEPGARVVYSDLGFLLLSFFAEKFFKRDFDVIVQEWVWDSIPGCGLHFRPVVTSARSALLQSPDIVATEVCPWRGLLQGQVHDDNSWSMGGISGHAGVFGRIQDVQLWIQAVMNGKLVSTATLEKFFQEVNPPVGARRTMGFDMTSLDGSGTTAFAFGPHSIGHLGYTGTSLWIDLDRGCYSVLLTNRVHLSRLDLRIRDLRRVYHTIIC